jgi:hypothetical protein
MNSLKKKEYNKRYWEKNKERLKIKNRERGKRYRANPKNKEKIKESNRKYAIKNREKIFAYHAKYRKENKEEINRKIREWYYKNIKKVKKRIKMYNKVYRNTLHFKIKDNMRRRIRTALKKDNGKKTQRTMKLVGCTVEELKQHIEKQFKPGMSWKKRHLFHIDHIIPCASFDLTKLSQQKKCFHYTNLQPLWAIDNIKKGAKLNYESQQ